MLRAVVRHAREPLYGKGRLLHVWSFKLGCSIEASSSWRAFCICRQREELVRQQLVISSHATFEPCASGSLPDVTIQLPREQLHLCSIRPLHETRRAHASAMATHPPTFPASFRGVVRWQSRSNSA